MGGIGFSLSIARTGDGMSLLAFHKHVWRLIDRRLGRLDGDRHAMTFTDYFGSEVWDGLGNLEEEDGDGGDWYRTETSLGFSFGDAAGCCSMSMSASYHWTRLAAAELARDGRLDAAGWTVAKPAAGAVEHALVLSSDCLAYTSAGLCSVARREPGRPLLDDSGRIAWVDSASVLWSDLALAERDALEWVALTAQCACDFCMARRPEVVHDVAAARAAWDLLETGEQRELEAQVAAAVRAWNWTDYAGPPELAVLSDWLMQRGANLALLPLASMVHRRVDYA